MRNLLATIALLASSLTAFSANSDWMTEVEAAFSKAKATNKHVLIEFTGSDWCPPCIQMRKNVFSKSAFTNVAKEDFILVEQYGIEGFPTVILFNSQGKEYDRFYASQYPTIKKFLSHLNTAKAKS